MLVAQWQNAVTRKDMVKFFSFRDFNEVKHVEVLLDLTPMALLGSFR